jgi:hypothetical protein
LLHLSERSDDVGPGAIGILGNLGGIRRAST